MVSLARVLTWSLPVALLSALGPSAAAREGTDSTSDFTINCTSGVRECVELVAEVLGDVTERFPAETHTFVALSQTLGGDDGPLLIYASVGVSRALPDEVDGVLLPNGMFTAMATRERPPGGFSAPEILEEEARALVAATRSLVTECRRTSACAVYDD